MNLSTFKHWNSSSAKILQVLSSKTQGKYVGENRSIPLPFFFLEEFLLASGCISSVSTAYILDVYVRITHPLIRVKPRTAIMGGCSRSPLAGAVKALPPCLWPILRHLQLILGSRAVPLSWQRTRQLAMCRPLPHSPAPSPGQVRYGLAAPRFHRTIGAFTMPWRVNEKV